MIRILPLRRDERGAAAVEFAMIIPVFFMLIVGTAQIGTFLYAHAAVRNAVSEGARYATIFPRPTAQQVIDTVKANRANLPAAQFTEPVVAYSQVGNTWVADISMSYSLKLNFIFFTTPAMTLNYSRRAYVFAPPTT